VRIVCDWRHKWSSFRVILAHVARPRAQPLHQSVSLKFSLETRLKSESFEPLIDFLAFLVQKLWSKINKIINYLISQIFLLTYITTFEPETPARHPKYQKTRTLSFPTLAPTLLDWLFWEQHGFNLTASAPVSDVSTPACTNEVWPPLWPMIVAQKNKLSTMSSNVQSITSSWTARPDDSGWWDNQMAAQHLPWDLVWPSSRQ